VAYCLFATLLISLTPTAAIHAATPNVVVILADDLGQGDLGCYNPESKIPTPHMDRIAATGMQFHDAHSPSSVCTPTRYGLLTGRYCWRTELKRGVLNGYSPMLMKPGRWTLATLLKQQGYHTGCVGKWHLGLGSQAKADYSKPLTPGAVEHGFDYFYVIPASLDMDPYLWVHNLRAVELPTLHDPGSKRRWDGGAGFWRAGPRAPSFHQEDVLPTIVEKSVEFLDRHAEEKPDEPFFLYVPFSAPHTPWLPTAEFQDKSQAGHYGDFTTQVDWSVGQITAALDRLNLSDNTLLIVTSDNGSHWRIKDIQQYDHQAHNGRRGMKSDIHEGGHRIPFLVRWPGRIEPGSQSYQTICLTDLMATLAAVVDVPLPEDAGEDSYNLLPAFRGKTLDGAIREATVHHSGQGMFAIRRGPWKLVRGLGSGGFTEPRQVKPTPGGPEGQLYNLLEDPAEKNNLWQSRQDVVGQLSALLDRYIQQGHSTGRLAVATSQPSGE
jgi:arylsulfatase A-like enzyme